MGNAQDKENKQQQPQKDAPPEAEEEKEDGDGEVEVEENNVNESSNEKKETGASPASTLNKEKEEQPQQDDPPEEDPEIKDVVNGGVEADDNNDDKSDEDNVADAENTPPPRANQDSDDAPLNSAADDGQDAVKEINEDSPPDQDESANDNGIVEETSGADGDKKEKETAASWICPKCSHRNQTKSQCYICLGYRGGTQRIISARGRGKRGGNIRKREKEQLQQEHYTTDHWSILYGSLILFFEEHGHTEVPSNHKLFPWVVEQRIKFDKLPGDRVKQLQILNFRVSKKSEEDTPRPKRCAHKGDESCNRYAAFNGFCHVHHPQSKITASSSDPEPKSAATNTPGSSNRSKKINLWRCDKCQKVAFESFEKALRHEETCQGGVGGVDENHGVATDRGREQSQGDHQQGNKSTSDSAANATKSPLSSTTNTINNSTTKRKRTLWQCDICKQAAFDNYDECVAHEKLCKKQKGIINPDHTPKGEVTSNNDKKQKIDKVWQCDICKQAVFQSYQLCVDHEKECKEKNLESAKEEFRKKTKPKTDKRWKCYICKEAVFLSWELCIWHEMECLGPKCQYPSCKTLVPHHKGLCPSHVKYCYESIVPKCKYAGCAEIGFYNGVCKSHKGERGQKEKNESSSTTIFMCHKEGCERAASDENDIFCTFHHQESLSEYKEMNTAIQQNIPVVHMQWWRQQEMNENNGTTTRTCQNEGCDRSADDGHGVFCKVHRNEYKTLEGHKEKRKSTVKQNIPRAYMNMHPPWYYYMPCQYPQCQLPAVTNGICHHHTFLSMAISQHQTSGHKQQTCTKDGCSTVAVVGPLCFQHAALPLPPKHLPRQKFSREDDLSLWQGHKDFGSGWAQISSNCFKGSRPAQRLRDRWHSKEFKNFVAKEFGPDAYWVEHETGFAKRKSSGRWWEKAGQDEDPQSSGDADQDSNKKEGGSHNKKEISDGIMEAKKSCEEPRGSGDSAKTKVDEPKTYDRQTKKTSK